MKTRQTGQPHIVYMVPDITDPAVSRRRSMLNAGGADIGVVGFHRRPLDAADGEVTGLGLTYDADFRQRLQAVVRWLFRPFRLRRLASGGDAVVARNLEMLLLARIALIGRPQVPLVYECLDVHRLMLGRNLPSAVLRFLEGRLLRRVSRVIVSSPAFQRHYFDRYHPRAPKALLVENRMLAIQGEPVPTTAPAQRPPPWRIGWFGMIRCRRSLEILADAARRSGGQIEVVIRGRPSPAVFPDLAEEVDGLTGVAFNGAYTQTELAALYGEVDFVWAIDYFEAGLNSAWLLPNRLYEGGAYNRPIIAQAGVETARWLDAHGAGLILQNPETDLFTLFESLTPVDYDHLLAAARRIPRRDLLCDRDACETLVDEICRDRAP